MEPSNAFLTCLLSFLLCAAVSATKGPYEGTGHEGFFGYEDCITLENESTRVILDPRWPGSGVLVERRQRDLSEPRTRGLGLSTRRNDD